ncbi:hypothetical protein EV401DRAFT_2058634 [Pisolithus croceorrhizus]|nr:hypothetical protein EV401DRAFT_2058634 [Pisolithus croceorrhizus]
MTERPSSEAVAAAATAALQRSRSPVVSVSEEHDYEKRQNFRRLIDPGIFRPNSRDQTLSSLRTLLRIADNLLREPDNPKFQQFKPTNDIIKRQLMEPKGTLEYAIALGFRAEVKDFQPYYVFNPRHVADLRIGAAILAEAIDLEEKKQERLKRSRAEEKAAAAAAAQNAHDRKTRALRDSRERARRNASEPHQVPSDIISNADASPSPEVVMPGVGYSLASPDPDVDQHE